MSKARARRHYRAAQRQIEESTVSGFFIPDEKRVHAVVIVILALLFAFIKGMWVYSVLARRNDA